MWTRDNIPDLTGKTAVVTGANTGIGYETAKALYEKGADVTIAARNEKKAAAAAQKIRQTRSKLLQRNSKLLTSNWISLSTMQG